MDEDQSWTSQITGPGGMISSLNSRLFIIKRLSASISKDRIKRIVDSLYTSKVRYGLQLLGKVRVCDSDPVNGLLSKLQVTQNQMARFLNNSKISDKISNKENLQQEQFNLGEPTQLPDQTHRNLEIFEHSKLPIKMGR